MTQLNPHERSRLTNAEVAELEAEIERLRAALDWINAEPEDPIKVQRRALVALGRDTDHAR